MLITPSLQPHAVLEGPTVANVADAKRRVEIVVWSNRLKEPPTHFISIPLNHSAIQEQFKEFKDVVLTTCQKVRNSDILCDVHIAYGLSFSLSTALESWYPASCVPGTSQASSDCSSGEVIQCGRRGKLIK